MSNSLRTLGNLVAFCLLVGATPILGQFERSELNFSCPCTFASSEGVTASINFTLVNHTEKDFEDLYITVGISGSQTTQTGATTGHAAFLDTVELGFDAEPEEHYDNLSYEIELGEMPTGSYYFELLLHQTDTVSQANTLDSVWFKGSHQTPVRSINLVDANFLLDSDSDGVTDLNEELEGFDPEDPASFPPPPIIDVLILHEDLSFEHYNTTPELFIAHVMAATNDMYERSDSPVFFRPVGILGTDVVPGIRDEESLEVSEYRKLLREYGADLVLVFRSSSGDLCGFAVSIGGENDKGFLHPNERFPYTEVFLDPRNCSLDTTAHEIGHLMGLGHSYVQESVGTYPWSRGHAIRGEFGTIMSYAEIVFQAIGMDVFSNPRQDCHGKPCGIDHTEPHDHGTADSSLSLNVLKYQFADTGEPSNTLDVDGDGVGAIDDAFPVDPTEWADRDGDTYGDNADAFPNEPTEWADTDGDGIGNNTDPDIDNDGILNIDDADPFNPMRSDSRFFSVVSHEEEDYFGFDTTRINDLNGDDQADLAMTAPGGRDANHNIVGKIYLMSHEELVRPPDASSDTPGVKQLDQLLTHEHTWVLHGDVLATPEDTLKYGTILQLAHARHSANHSELWVQAGQSVFLIQLSTAALNGFDGLDGNQDRQIHFEHCDASEACLRLAYHEQFQTSSITVVDDIDGDGLNELGVLGSEEEETLSLYVMNRASIGERAYDDEGNPQTLNSLFSVDERNLVIKGTGTLLAKLQSRASHPFNSASELTLGVAASDPQGQGRAYILDVDQLKNVSMFDADGDRQIELDDLVLPTQTTRITHSDISHFGLGVTSLSDLDGDGQQELFVSGFWGFNYALFSTGLRTLDFLDFDYNGAVQLDNNSVQSKGIWRFNQFYFDGITQASAILTPEQEDQPDILLTHSFRGRALLVAELSDFDYLDDPLGVDLNGVINLPVRIRYPGIYQLRPSLGPRGWAVFSGILPLGDIDDDQIVDFGFAVHSQELEGQFSQLFVVPSSELITLDSADGNTDSIVGLHNTQIDTDNDGIPNLHDNDDDGDGLIDFYDEFPLHVDFQYDADRDGFANGIDLYPLASQWHSDIDNDGIGDREDEDIDGDGILNADDALPRDTDNDEYSNDIDVDDDNDGYIDLIDAFPLDATEWIDTDGDGYGDNSDLFPNDPERWQDSTDDDDTTDPVFRSYSIVGKWFETLSVSENLTLGSVYSLRDFDHDGHGDLEIANVLPHQAGSPLLVLSGADLEALDERDESRDNTFTLESIREGPNSWQLINENQTASSSQFSRATVSDLDNDNTTDLVIFNPDFNEATGILTVLLGGSWAELDGLGGDAIDGIIGINRCVESGVCKQIQGSHPDQGFGTSGGFVYNRTNEQASLLVGTNQASPLNTNEFTHAAAFLIPYEDLQEVVAVEEQAKTEWEIGDFSTKNTLGFYLLDDTLSAEERKLNAMRFLDYDLDKVDETAFSLPQQTEERIYLIASSNLNDLVSTDDDGVSTVNIGATPQQQSYQLTNLALNDFNESKYTNELDETTYLMSFQDRDSATDSWLVDMRQLDGLDRADGTVDGIVAKLTADGQAVWTFPHTRTLKLCKPDSEGDRVQALASSHRLDGRTETQGELQFEIFNLAALDELATGTSEQEGTIDLTSSENLSVEATWHVALGSLGEFTKFASLQCAGDIDGDGFEDVAISLTDERDAETRLQILLISFNDLEQLDELDGNQDYRVDVSLVWSDR